MASMSLFLTSGVSFEGLPIRFLLIKSPLSARLFEPQRDEYGIPHMLCDRLHEKGRHRITEPRPLLLKRPPQDEVIRERAEPFSFRDIQAARVLPMIQTPSA